MFDGLYIYFRPWFNFIVYFLKRVFYMGRLFILLGLTFLFMHLHASGNISKYINMEYSYVSQIAIYILAMFTLMGSYIYIKEGNQEASEDCQCGHDRSQENKKWKKTLLTRYF